MNIINVVTLGELNLFKAKGEIVHIKSDTVKLLNVPTLIPMPIAAYFQKKSIEERDPQEEPSPIILSDIQECSIDEASSFFELPKEEFKLKKITDY
jgi:hypothetical protein